MNKYLLSVHVTQGEAQGPASPEEAQKFMGRVEALEADMHSRGAFVFGGHLYEPDVTTVVHPSGAGLSMTDGPFSESKEQIGGFYIINAADLDDALAWAGRVVEAIQAPIEVRSFSDESQRG